MEDWYYSKMNKVQQSVYRDMLEGFRQQRDEFQVTKLEASDLSNVFFRLRLDHPEMFWVTNFHYRFYADSPNLIIYPDYLFDKGKIKEQQRAMESRVEKLVRPAMKLSPLEKELHVHDFICRNVHYDKLKKAYSHEIIGPLGQGVGVCEGIAKAVKVLCDALGLWCMIAICGNNPEKGIKYRHTWNIVKLDGKYYHLDCTFDNSLGRRIAEKEAPLVNGIPQVKPEDIAVRYDYFNLDDRAVFRDHEPLIAPAPVCDDNSRFYYKEKKVSFTKPEDVSNRAKQTAKKGKPFTFHWRGGYLTGKVLQELACRMQAEGLARKKLARISVNRSQAVIHLEYAEAGEEELAALQAKLDEITAAQGNPAGDAAAASDDTTGGQNADAADMEAVAEETDEEALPVVQGLELEDANEGEHWEEPDSV